MTNIRYRIKVMNLKLYMECFFRFFRIGFSVARRLAQEGAKVIISSRREANVNNAVDQLTAEGLQVSGVVCHVGQSEDRKKLFNEASISINNYYAFQCKCYTLNVLSFYDAVLGNFKVWRFGHSCF